MIDLAMPAVDPAVPLEISVVIPLYDEEENLPILAAELRTTMRALGRPYEILFVDDGSTDGSAEVLARLAQSDPALRVLRLPRNAGQSAALAAGFRAARGAIVVTLDADLQNDPADIPRLLAELVACDAVCGIRARRQDPWLRRVSARLANAVRNRVTGEAIADAGCSLRAMRAEVLRRIPMFHGMHRFLPTLLHLAGAQVTEIEVNHRPRRRGTAHYNVRNRLGRALVDLWGVRWLQSRWIDRGLVEAEGGHANRHWVPKAEILRVLRSQPEDPTFFEDLGKMGGTAGKIEDPFAASD